MAAKKTKPARKGGRRKAVPAAPARRKKGAPARRSHTGRTSGAADGPAQLKAAVDRKREYNRDRHAQHSRSGRDIAPLPEVVNPARRAACERDLQHFLLTYFAHLFPIPWSPDHKRTIGKAQRAVLDGGLFGTAMPRGSGKTTILECCCIWAVIYGHRPFVAMFGPEASHAEKLLESIKVELEGNDLLLEDFPEVCYPIRALEGIGQRRMGQLFEGERTQIGWGKKEIVLPMIAGSRAAGGIIKAAGITASFRGLKHKRADGTTIRPSLVFLDDIQSEKSADSPRGCEVRKRILTGAILGLAGPGQKIAGLLAATVLRPGDVADDILSPEKHPEWSGERVSAFRAWPANMKLWQRYGEITADSMRAGRGIADGTAFYIANRAEMDAGAQPYWPERFNSPEEVSATQNLMNLCLQNEEAFWAEMMNKPRDLTLSEASLTPDDIASKVNGLARGFVPVWASHLVAFIDVQGSLLYYCVAAVADDFSGAIVDYSAYPDQQRSYWSLRDASPTLQDMVRGVGLEGAIHAGLTALTVELLGREWLKEGGGMRIGKCLIDANWGASTDIVHEFVRRSQFSAQLLASHGRFFGASATPINQYSQKPGERVGPGWRVARSDKRASAYALFDANFYKSFLVERLRAAKGDKGCWELFGDKPRDHRLFSEHLTAEFSVSVEAKGRTVDEWKLKPNRENHLLDCAVGCCVAASILGASITGAQKTQRRKVNWAEQQRQQLAKQARDVTQSRRRD